jgi:hypothetical protein
MVTTNTSYGIANFTYDVKTNGVEHTLILGKKKTIEKQFTTFGL